MSISRDTVVAIVLLAVCGGLGVASLDIREPDYGQLSPAAWPRAILVALTVLSLIYFVQSLRGGGDAETPLESRGRDLAAQGESAESQPKTVGAFFHYWRNVIACFAIFGVYLLAIPQLGMLVGGVLFVFALLTALGGLRAAPLHAVVAVVAVGGMWLLFTRVLNVILPSGELTGF